MYHHLTSKEAVTQLNSNETEGLSPHEAAARLNLHGYNRLPEGKKQNNLIKFLKQFKDFLILVLLLASLFSFFIGEFKDGTVILFIILANAVLGFIQEAKADNAIAALKKLSVANAKVIRGGQTSLVNASELVPGDIIILENGDKIPADGRLLEAIHLKISESALTGESKPVDKDSEFIGEKNINLGDRVNMVYKDTVIMFGRGRALVTATGTQTQIGKIFELLQKQENKITALSRELSRVGKGLTIFAGIAALLIFGAILLSREPNLKHAFLTSISMAIAVVPEGIPAVVTTVLAISVARLAHSRAVVRKMEAVETLGSASSILTDKTGTLTKNEMSVTDIYIPGRHIQVQANYSEAGQKVNIQTDEKLKWLIHASVLCNDAQISETGSLIGDPTETCLLVAAQKAGFSVQAIRSEYERIFEIPFSSETKRMVVVVKNKQGAIYAITKGACEIVSRYLKEHKDAACEISEKLSENGIRNLAYASKIITNIDPDFANTADLLQNQEYLGVIGAKDPLRPEVKEAVNLAAGAGVKTIIITGDHKNIALNIGTELGLIKNASEVIDGAELEKMGVENLPSLLDSVKAFSRVSPEQKLKIVQAAMQKGETVIVTGDGVNDAPAIKTADIGVAMGVSGTDVAKEAADVVLMDDNYSTIVEAIKQGRGIFNNFIKFLKYQISCNLSGVLIVFPITVLGFATPLLPVHILMLNLISETGPSIALGLEKPETNIMLSRPRKKNERLLTKARWKSIVLEACLMAAAGIAAFFATKDINIQTATTAVLTTAFLSRLWHAFNSRSENLSMFSGYLQKNHWLYLTVAGTILFLAFAVYSGPGNSIMKTVPLSSSILFLCAGLSLIPVAGMEIYKLFKKKQ